MTWAIMCEISSRLRSACSDCHCVSHICQIKTALQLGCDDYGEGLKGLCSDGNALLCHKCLDYFSIFFTFSTCEIAANQLTSYLAIM